MAETIPSVLGTDTPALLFKVAGEPAAIDTLSSDRRSEIRSVLQFEMFHEQLPLPVPCYDLLPVIEFTVGRD